LYKTYSVAPNVDLTGWLVKIEDAVPEDVYDSKSDAMDVAEQLAQENSPSIVQIKNQEDEIEEELRY
jgi:hypothetical protein